MTTPATSGTPNRTVPSPLVCAWVPVANPTANVSWPVAFSVLNVALPSFCLDTIESPAARGAEALVRMRYPAALAVSTQCQGYVLGRKRGLGSYVWSLKRSRDGTLLTELTTAASDIPVSATEKATTVDLAKHSFELGGDDELTWVPTQALAGSGATAADARVEMTIW